MSVLPSRLPRALALAILIGAAAMTSGSAAQAADPAPKADAVKKPPKSCGEYPRSSKAYRDCIAAEQKRDAPAGQAGVKPAFSSR